jgi:uncharacterized protein (DUF433 family)
MSQPDRLKAWAARKRERSKEKTTSPVANRPAPARDEALRVQSPALVEERNGQLYPKGSSVTVKQIAFHHAVARKSTADIVAQFARDLTPAQCHAALSYYYLHRDEVDAELERDREMNAPGVLAGTGHLPRLGLEELTGVSEG